MAALSSSLAAVLGVIGGAYIAYIVPDETQWYPKWFYLSAGVFTILSAVTAQPVALRVAAAIVLLYALKKEYTWLVAVCSGILLLFTGLTAQQLLLISLLFVGGYLYSKGQRKQLLWFLLTPLIVLLSLAL